MELFPPISAKNVSFCNVPKDAPDRSELIALGKENWQIELERDILATATAWFAN